MSFIKPRHLFMRHMAWKLGDTSANPGTALTQQAMALSLSRPQCPHLGYRRLLSVLSPLPGQSEEISVLCNL